MASAISPVSLRLAEKIACYDAAAFAAPFLELTSLGAVTGGLFVVVLGLDKLATK